MCMIEKSPVDRQFWHSLIDYPKWELDLVKRSGYYIGFRHEDDWDFCNENPFVTTTSLQPSIECAINENATGFLDVLIRQQQKLNYDEKKCSTDDIFHRCKWRYRHTMLNYAIDRKASECISLILENIFARRIYFTIIDHVCLNGRTALWYACLNGDFDLVQILVERGRATIHKCGVLIVATQNGHRISKNCNETALHAASRRNHINLVKLLLACGANTTVFDYKERTPLDYAIHKRHNEIGKILISHQNGYFIMSQTGFTPLMLATYCNNQPIANILENILSTEQILDEMTLVASTIWIWILNRKSDKKQITHLFRLLFLITHLIESGSVNDNERHILLDLVYQALQKNIIIENEYPLFSYLISRISMGQHIYTYSFLNIPILFSLRVSIDSGVDVNEVILSAKSTLLHLIARCHTDAHIDCIDRNGSKPEDLALIWEIRMFLQENRKLSLKCQCAHLINTRNLSYRSHLSSALINFIRMHGTVCS
ncbi:hypothetical protein I4U23_015231 [Adineta vaga]|nr:hypothetical protein I4U23_015231 [Adineta vaga]